MGIIDFFVHFKKFLKNFCAFFIFSGFLMEFMGMKSLKKRT